MHMRTQTPVERMEYLASRGLFFFAGNIARGLGDTGKAELYERKRRKQLEEIRYSIDREK